MAGEQKKVIPHAYTRISIDEEVGGVFHSCEFPGIDLTTDAVDVYTSEGKGEKIHTNSIATYTDVTLIKGVTDDKALYDWMDTLKNSGMDGNVKDITIDACDNEGNPVMTWSLTDAYIKSYKPGPSKAGGSSMLSETVVLGFKEARREA